MVKCEAACAILFPVPEFCPKCLEKTSIRKFPKLLQLHSFIEVHVSEMRVKYR